MIFLVFLIVPKVIALVDDSIDISVFYTFGEEEGSEKDKELELLFFELNNPDLDFMSSEVENNTEYYFKNYPTPHLNLVFPPPQFHIL